MAHVHHHHPISSSCPCLFEPLAFFFANTMEKFEREKSRSIAWPQARAKQNANRVARLTFVTPFTNHLSYGSESGKHKSATFVLEMIHSYYVINSEHWKNVGLRNSIF